MSRVSLEKALAKPPLAGAKFRIYTQDNDSEGISTTNEITVSNPLQSDIPVKALAYGGLVAGVLSSAFKLRSNKSYGSMLERLKDWLFPIATLGVSALSFVLDYFSRDYLKTSSKESGNTQSLSHTATSDDLSAESFDKPGLKIYNPDNLKCR